MRPIVAVIGGGISGLSAAHALARYAAHIDIVLLEASNRLGGVLETTRRDGFLVEAAAENFMSNPPAAVDLCREIDKSDWLITTNSQHRRSFVVHRGQLEPIPAGFVAMAPSRMWPLVKSRVLSWRGKVRAGLEYFVPPRGGDEDESVASFVCRRFGSELYERLVQPLIGSIYGGEPERLSIAATMPRFRQMECESGSVVRATFRKRREDSSDSGSGARYSQFAALRDGMSSFVDALAERLPAGTVQVSSPVNHILRLEHGRWLLLIEGEHRRWLEVDALVMATPAYRASKLLAGLDSTLADDLAEIEYSSCAVVSLGYRRDQVKRSLDGFGFVVPAVERRNILSCSYSSVKYAGRAPEDSVLLRIVLGGTAHRGLLSLTDVELVELARCEVSELLRIGGEPVLSHLSRRRHSIPQYHVGHRQRVETIKRRLARFPTLALAGNAYCGVGIPACIQSGQAAAEQCLAHLKLHGQISCVRTAAAEASV